MTMASDATVQPWADYFSRDAATVTNDLGLFEKLVRKWQAAQNLVSRETLDAFWTRHVVDSLQVLSLLPADAKKVFDLGSGGGFPGIPLAIARKGSGTQFLLCEANARKIAFLRTAIRELALDAKTLSGRIETLDSRETGKADIVLARALAPLNQLMTLAYPLLDAGGRMVVHKGRENQREIDEASSNWQFDVIKHESATDDFGVLLDIGCLRPRS